MLFAGFTPSVPLAPDLAVYKPKYENINADAFYRVLASLVIPRQLQKNPKKGPVACDEATFDLQSSADTDPLNIELIANYLECITRQNDIYIVNAYTTASMFHAAHASLGVLPAAARQQIYYLPLLPMATFRQNVSLALGNLDSVPWHTTNHDTWLPLNERDMNLLSAQIVIETRKHLHPHRARPHKRKQLVVHESQLRARHTRRVGAR